MPMRECKLKQNSKQKNLGEFNKKIAKGKQDKRLGFVAKYG